MFILIGFVSSVKCSL